MAKVTENVTIELSQNEVAALGKLLAENGLEKDHELYDLFIKVSGYY